VRRISSFSWRALVLLVLLGASVAVLSSCAAVLNAIEDRLPPPHEIGDGILFRYYAPSARQVTLAGSFNNWGGTQGGGRYDTSIARLSDDDGDGIWSIVVPLPPGRYQYKFVIDGGVRWEKDPSNQDVASEGGIENSLIVVPPTVAYDYGVITGTVIGGEERSTVDREAPPPPAIVVVAIEVDFPAATEVFISGDFNAWEPAEHRLEKAGDGLFRITLELEPGTYEYKFVVDGTWVEDPGNPDAIPDPYGGVNSVLTVE
jgi:1,4-alpha-glucan branching enzyme